jgi:hypothetical protein
MVFSIGCKQMVPLSHCFDCDCLKLSESFQNYQKTVARVDYGCNPVNLKFVENHMSGKRKKS